MASGQSLAYIPSCACKGIRSCLICESEDKRTNNEDIRVYRYCDKCDRAWPVTARPHPDHSGEDIRFDGIQLHQNFVTPDEEVFLLSEIDKIPFIDSQSGRRKQDYGPKANFKKKKLNCSAFSGLPSFSKLVYEKMRNLHALSDFLPVELCNLEYSPERGSAIDPHFDDFWLWGERLVTLNLLSDTVLCFIKDEQPDIEIQVPLARRSLIIVSGEARNVWKHGIPRNKISGRRLAMTFRELSKEFENLELSKSLIELALLFNGQSVGTVTSNCVP